MKYGVQWADTEQRLILDYYYTVNTHSLGNLVWIIKVLQKFKNKDTIDCYSDILKLDNKRVIEHLVKAWIEIDAPLDRLKFVSDMLYSKNSEQLRLAFSIFSKNKAISSFLPDSEILYNLYVDGIRLWNDNDTSFSLSTMFRENVIQLDASRIYTGICSKDLNEVLASIYLVNEIADYEDENIEPFTSEKFEERFFELIESQNDYISEYTFYIIGKIGSYKGKSEYINKLIDFIIFENQDFINRAAMKCINEILERVDFNPVIIEKYLIALESDNVNYKLASLDGLKWSKDKAFKNSLLKYKDHPSEEVQEAVDELFEYQDNIDGGKFFMNTLTESVEANQNKRAQNIEMYKIIN